MSLLLEPIGLIQNNRVNLEDDYWGEVISEIIMDGSKFKEDCLFGLEQFSHIEVIFYMNKVEPDKIQFNANGIQNPLLLTIHILIHQADLALLWPFEKRYLPLANQFDFLDA